MWFVYSLFFAIWTSISLLIIKKLTAKIDSRSLLFIVFIFTIPAVFILLMLTGGIPRVTTNFYVFITIAALMDSVAFLFQFSAINRAPISLIAPIASFTPLFTTIFAIFTLGEIPTPFKFFGIILIVFGAYLLNIEDIKKGIFAPIKDLFANRAVRFMLFSTFLWSITPIFQKKAIFETFPQTPLYTYFIDALLVGIILCPFAIKKAINYKKEVSINLKWFILFGIGTAIAAFAAWTAFSLANVGYVTTVLRLSGLFSIILGGVFLKEQKIKEKFIAAAIMLAGVFILVI